MTKMDGDLRCTRAQDVSKLGVVVRWHAPFAYRALRQLKPSSRHIVALLHRHGRMMRRAVKVRRCDEAVMRRTLPSKVITWDLWSPYKVKKCRQPFLVSRTQYKLYVKFTPFSIGRGVAPWALAAELSVVRDRQRRGLGSSQ